MFHITWNWFNLDADLFSFACSFLFLVVILDAGDDPDLDKLLGGDADGRASSDDACLDRDSRHNGIPRVENAVRHHFELAREDGYVFELFLLFGLELVLVCHEPVKQMVNNVRLERK